MNQVTLLRDALRPHLSWHGARLSFLAAFLIALLRVKTVNFNELATAFSGTAKAGSHYKRLQRFFRDFEMDYAAIAHTVVALMGIPSLGCCHSTVRNGNLVGVLSTFSC